MVFFLVFVRNHSIWIVFTCILKKYIHATCNNFNHLTELQIISGNQSIETNELGPNLWISYDWAGAQPSVALGGHRPTHWRARTSQSEWAFPHTRSLVQTEILLSVIICLGGWFQTIPQVKKTVVEVLGWCGYTCSAVVRPVGRTAKFSKMMLKAAYGREINSKFSGTNLVDIHVVSMSISHFL
jgi:hypothetical protein